MGKAPRRRLGGMIGLAGRWLGAAEGREREGGGPPLAGAAAGITAEPEVPVTDSEGVWLGGVPAACIDAGLMDWRVCDRLAVPEVRRSPHGPMGPPGGVAYLRCGDGTAVVVKGGRNAGTELCAAEVAAAAGVLVPRMRIVTRGEPEYGEIVFALERLALLQAQWHGEVVSSLRQEKHLLVVQHVHGGRTVDGIPQPDMARTLCGAEGAFMAKLGELMALDLVLNNGARFPTLPIPDGDDEEVREVDLASIVADESGRLWACENLGSLTADSIATRGRVLEVEKACGAIAARNPNGSMCPPIARVVAGLRQRSNLPSLDKRAGHMLAVGFTATAARLARLKVDDYRGMVDRAVETVGDVAEELDDALPLPLDAELMAGVSACFQVAFG